MPPVCQHWVGCCGTMVTQTHPGPQQVDGLVDDTKRQLLSMAVHTKILTFRGSQTEVWEEGLAHLAGDLPWRGRSRVSVVLVVRECVGQSLHPRWPLRPSGGQSHGVLGSLLGCIGLRRHLLQICYFTDEATEARKIYWLTGQWVAELEIETRCSDAPFMPHLGLSHRGLAVTKIRTHLGEGLFSVLWVIYTPGLVTSSEPLGE